MIQIIPERYFEMDTLSSGVCLECHATQSRVEPDAQGYKCKSCGKPAVCGIEHATLIGEVEVSEEKIEGADSIDDDSLESYWNIVHPTRKR
jgi:hypothetical protein